MVWKFGMEIFIHITIKKETCKGLFPVYSVFMKLNQWMVPEEQRVLLQQQRGPMGNCGRFSHESLRNQG
jgi:hypothetical protein